MTLTKASAKKLATCHPDLIRLMEAVAAKTPICIVSGYRGKAEQDAAFRSGASKKRFPGSKHNVYPSRAVDIAPLINGKIPLNSKGEWDAKFFAALSIMVKQQARALGIPIVWGGDWKDPYDTPHYQLKD